MTGYTKLFSSILGSTVWREPAATKVVWITMLALADRHDEVEASIPGLANFAGTTIGETETAIARFLAPDPYSRTPDHEGRRIEAIDGGWYILNHIKYRDKMSAEDKNAQAAIRQQRSRDRKKVTQERDATVTGVTCNASNDTQTQTQTQTQKPKPPAAGAAARGLCVRLGVTGNKNAAELQEVIALAATEWNTTNETEIADRLLEAWEFHKTHPRKEAAYFIFTSPMIFMTGGAWIEADKLRASDARSEEWMRRKNAQSAQK
jgi:ribosome assembly protein YihI (activator of Der GTPase)